MGNRLSKIITRTGDAGETGLGDGCRLPKAHPRFGAIGAIDELNSHIGVLLCETMPENCREMLVWIQHQLFNVGGELAMPGWALVSDDDAAQLESYAQTLNADLPPLKEFILPGGNRSAALGHVARTVCRRAERELWLLHKDDSGIRLELMRLLNRLSDVLFILSRFLARQNGGSEVFWQKKV